MPAVGNVVIVNILKLIINLLQTVVEILSQPDGK